MLLASQQHYAQGCCVGGWDPCVATVLPRTLYRVPLVTHPTCDTPARAVPLGLGHSHFSLSLRQTLAHVLPAPNRCEFYLLCWQQIHQGGSVLHPHTSTSTLALAAAAPQKGLSLAHFPWLVAPWVQCGISDVQGQEALPGKRSWLGWSHPTPWAVSPLGRAGVD